MTPRSNPPGHINRETLSRELIDDRQALQAATIGAGVEHEVVRPHVIDRRRWQRPRTTGGHPPTRPFLRHLEALRPPQADRKSTRLNSSHSQISYAVFCLKKKKKNNKEKQ